MAGKNTVYQLNKYSNYMKLTSCADKNSKTKFAKRGIIPAPEGAPLFWYPKCTCTLYPINTHVFTEVAVMNIVDLFHTSQLFWHKQWWHW